MKINQYSALLKERDGEEYTHFVIGKKVDEKLKNYLFCLGATKVKETKRFEHFEVKGNKLYLMLL